MLAPLFYLYRGRNIISIDSRNGTNLYVKMKEQDVNKEVNLTKNEQKVLKHILDKANISDTKISEEISISQQAVNQIRSRLEELGVIKGYTPVIDFKKIGIKFLILTGIKLKQHVWKAKKEWQIEQSLEEIPYIYQAYRIIGQDISHALLMGFNSTDQRDKFLRKLQTAYEDELVIKWNYTIAVEDVLLQDPSSLLYLIIDKKEYEIDKLFM